MLQVDITWGLDRRRGSAGGVWHWNWTTIGELEGLSASTDWINKTYIRLVSIRSISTKTSEDLDRVPPAFVMTIGLLDVNSWLLFSIPGTASGAIGTLLPAGLPGVFKIDCSELTKEPCPEPVLFVLVSEAAVPVMEPGMYWSGWPVVLAKTGGKPWVKTWLELRFDRTNRSRTKHNRCVHYLRVQNTIDAVYVPFRVLF